MRPCLSCRTLTSNPKFCSRRCAAKVNNSLFPKRKRKVSCTSCSAPIYVGQRLCDSCARRLRRYRNKPMRRRYLKHYMRDYMRRWRKSHPRYYGDWGREARRKLRLEVMDGLGGRHCARCGCSDIRVLEINHVHGGGRREQRASGRDQMKMLRQIRRGDRPGEFEVLCKVCNAAHYCETFGLAFEVHWLPTRLELGDASDSVGQNRRGRGQGSTTEPPAVSREDPVRFRAPASSASEDSLRPSSSAHLGETHAVQHSQARSAPSYVAHQMLK